MYKEHSNQDYSNAKSDKVYILFWTTFKSKQIIIKSI